MPISLLEAMAAGLPVAATDVGDVRHILSDENQPYIVPKDPLALANALADLLADPSQAALIGRNNLHRVHTQYDQRHMFDAYRNLYSNY
jgi:glycosyltransferase involved in cell wall biosynthesis